jgi:hypothetical protein
MNLEKLNVAELNSQEIKETEGGLWVLVIKLAAAALGTDAAINYGSTCEAMQAGFKDGQDANPL